MGRLGVSEISQATVGETFWEICGFFPKPEYTRLVQLTGRSVYSFRASNLAVPEGAWGRLFSADGVGVGIPFFFEPSFHFERTEA